MALAISMSVMGGSPGRAAGMEKVGPNAFANLRNDSMSRKQVGNQIGEWDEELWVVFCPYGGGTPGCLTRFTLPALLSFTGFPVLVGIVLSHLSIVWTVAIFTKAPYLTLHYLIHIPALPSFDGFSRYFLN